MKTPLIATSLLIALALVARADDASGVIQASDKAALDAAVGNEVTVQGKVKSAKWSKTGKVCSIEFEGEPNFTAAVFEKGRVKMDAAFGGDFTKQFTGAVIKITGRLAEYGGPNQRFKDAKQISISDTGQVTIVTLAPGSEPHMAPATMPTAP